MLTRRGLVALGLAASGGEVKRASAAPARSLRLQSPGGRIEAMHARLAAMLHAVDLVQPALARFYGSLSDEQKERFNRLSPLQG